MKELRVIGSIYRNNSVKKIFYDNFLVTNILIVINEF